MLLLSRGFSILFHSCIPETIPQAGLVTSSTETDTKEENVSINQREIEDQLMIESEHIEIEPKHNDKDDFSMDPIFNEIIEPSLRVTSGTIS